MITYRFQINTNNSFDQNSADFEIVVPCMSINGKNERKTIETLPPHHKKKIENKPGNTIQFNAKGRENTLRFDQETIVHLITNTSMSKSVGPLKLYPCKDK